MALSFLLFATDLGETFQRSVITDAPNTSQADLTANPH